MFQDGRMCIAAEVALKEGLWVNVVGQFGNIERFKFFLTQRSIE